MNAFFKEFKEFALKGNVMDMAVGVIMGGALTTIVKSLTEDIIMPLLGILLGQVNITNLALTVANPLGGADVVLSYGNFLQSIINFLFTALALFLLIRGMNRLHLKKEEAPAPAPEPSKEEILLTEIRDLMKEKR